jgi:hypothetical protein
MLNCAAEPTAIVLTFPAVPFELVMEMEPALAAEVVVPPQPAITSPSAIMQIAPKTRMPANTLCSLGPIPEWTNPGTNIRSNTDNIPNASHFLPATVVAP